MKSVDYQTSQTVVFIIEYYQFLPLVLAGPYPRKKKKKGIKYQVIN